MKKYEVRRFIGGEVTVNVPTPKELQAKTIVGKIQVIISNFSNNGRQKYAVAKFEPETNKTFINMGIPFKTSANENDIYEFSGENSRQEAIDCAADLLFNPYKGGEK